MSSLPAWECGLKYGGSGSSQGQGASLPAWECGLKFVLTCGVDTQDKSLPAWECGLKYQHHVGGAGYIRHSLRGSVD